MYNIVSIGAGTGQACILKGLSTLPGCQTTAIVTTTDNGGSSAIVRESLDIPSPGDVRNIINTINKDTGVFSKLLNYRFSKGELTGTHLGNLIIGALSEIEGSYLQAIESIQELINCDVKVLPVSDISTQICAQLENNEDIIGERQIIKRSQQNQKVMRYYLQDKAPASNKVIKSIHDADLVIICPGVLGTGVISTLLFEGVQEALLANQGKLIYICNIMTYHSQTDNFAVSDHVSLLETYTKRPIDIVVAHDTPPPTWIQDIYRKDHSEYVPLDRGNIPSHTHVIAGDFLDKYEENSDHLELDRTKHKKQHVGRHLIRHDHKKIAQMVQSILAE